LQHDARVCWAGQFQPVPVVLCHFCGLFLCRRPSSGLSILIALCAQGAHHLPRAPPLGSRVPVLVSIVPTGRFSSYVTSVKHGLVSRLANFRLVLLLWRRSQLCRQLFSLVVHFRGLWDFFPASFKFLGLEAGLLAHPWSPF